MPKDNIDYSNTIIYKIYCNDKSINHVYVGHTTNFTKRKYQHKIACNDLNQNQKIYNTIREHGGWDNWNMIEVAKYHCKDKTEARIKEQEHYALLNSSPQLVSTPKHNQEKIGNKMEIPTISPYFCECKREYKTVSGLWKHKKKCTFFENNNNNIETTQEVNIISPELILNIINQNQEFKDLLVEQNKTIIELSKNCSTTTTTHINTMNNSNNKSFNLNFFLNETCKDAMNITDFVNSIQLQLTDFENIGEQGYINGISNLIIKNLKALDENMRPVHCSDLKRESIYVKENDTWEKDTNNNQRLKKAIQAIAHKNTKMIPKYREKYPDSQLSYSKASDNYNKFVLEAMGGSGDNDDEKTEKIIKRIAKEIVIQKT